MSKSQQGTYVVKTGDHVTYLNPVRIFEAVIARKLESNPNFFKENPWAIPVAILGGFMIESARTALASIQNSPVGKKVSAAIEYVQNAGSGLVPEALDHAYLDTAIKAAVEAQAGTGRLSSEARRIFGGTMSFFTAENLRDFLTECAQFEIVNLDGSKSTGAVELKAAYGNNGTTTSRAWLALLTACAAAMAVSATDCVETYRLIDAEGATVDSMPSGSVASQALTASIAEQALGTNGSAGRSASKTGTGTPRG